MTTAATHQDFVDALREFLGLDALYNGRGRRTELERFGGIELQSLRRERKVAPPYSK